MKWRTRQAPSRTVLAGQAVLSAAGGCAISIWSFEPGTTELGSWGASPPSPKCPVANFSQPIVTGDSLTLIPNPSNLLPLGGQGYLVVIIANTRL